MAGDVVSSGKRLGEGPRVRRLGGAQSGASLDERLAAAGQGCPNRPPCRHGDGLHKDGVCTALGCCCGVLPVRPGPLTRGQLWRQAYLATLHLPSWERGQQCRARFEVGLVREELLRIHEVPGPMVGPPPQTCPFCRQPWRGLDSTSLGAVTRCCQMSRSAALERLS